MIQIDRFFDRQLESWPLAADNFRALSGVKVREIEGASGMKAQFNPARIVSTGAKVDAATLKERPCFLCGANRPGQQTQIEWGDYDVLVNPYPIAPRHFTIARRRHMPQLNSIADMVALAAEIPGYTVFYNGARCGASAPDHMHFQAVPDSFLPIWSRIAPDNTPEGVSAMEAVSGIGVFAIRQDSPEGMAQAYSSVMDKLRPYAPQGEEPMVNVLCRQGLTVVIPRKKHRPSCYGSDEGKILLSPASIDLSGLLILPREEDFNNIDAETVKTVLAEVCYTKTELCEM